jgi:hypothetical protein
LGVGNVLVLVGVFVVLISSATRRMLVATLPFRHWLGVSGAGEESSDRGSLPVDGSQDDRDDACVSLTVALQGGFHFALVAVVRVDEVGADEQEDQVGGREVFVDGVIEEGSRGDAPVVPRIDEVASFER